MRKATPPSLKNLGDQLVSICRKHNAGTPICVWITGTDTGVGKTEITSRLLRHLDAHGVCAAGLKPVCCGDRDDAEKLRAASSQSFSLDIHNPIHLPKPLAPVAQKHPHWKKLVQSVKRSIRRFQHEGVKAILVEGVGGVLCPFAGERSFLDLIRLANSRVRTDPVIIVARDRLGVLNHTLVTIAVLNHAGIKPAAVVLNRFGKKELAHKTNHLILSPLLPCRLFLSQ
jgi:dethiobiotin synthetase